MTIINPNSIWIMQKCSMRNKCDCVIFLQPTLHISPLYEVAANIHKSIKGGAFYATSSTSRSLSTGRLLKTTSKSDPSSDDELEIVARLLIGKELHLIIAKDLVRWNFSHFRIRVLSLPFAHVRRFHVKRTVRLQLTYSFVALYIQCLTVAHIFQHKYTKKSVTSVFFSLLNGRSKIEIKRIHHYSA